MFQQRKIKKIKYQPRNITEKDTIRTSPIL